MSQLRQIIRDRTGSDDDDNLISRYPVYVICRRGFMSVKGTSLLLENGFQNVRNVDGGVTQWQKRVDPEFPLY